jgi:hypothetical protein
VNHATRTIMVSDEDFGEHPSLRLRLQTGWLRNSIDDDLRESARSEARPRRLNLHLAPALHRTHSRRSRSSSRTILAGAGRSGVKSRVVDERLDDVAENFFGGRV